MIAMNISSKMQNAINGQINYEFFSAYIYLGMSAHCEAEGWTGCAHWLRVQWQEEVGHATRLLDYVLRRGGRVTLHTIDQPPAKFGALQTLFEQVLEHEQSVTARIHKLVDQAQSEKDHATVAELQWFVTEQVEEEEQATLNVELLKKIGKHEPALLMFDRKLAERAAG
jgi:ferritin